MAEVTKIKTEYMQQHEAAEKRAQERRQQLRKTIIDIFLTPVETKEYRPGRWK